ncbi:MAG TPA: D-alanyl-D-alanine carboxypeptidase family protein [Casimicrobiaceae bacterium]|nr:D-alanyl-D-alanine carboxypeptidase family protein [Casimicrobiaceae bacterium]
MAAATFALLFSVASQATSQTPASPAAASSATALPVGAFPAPAVGAAAYILLDLTSGQTLVANNADEKRDPASLTKLMTAYLTFGALRQKVLMPSQMVNVTPKAWKAEGSRMFIEPRKSVSIEELLKGMIVQSGNDASIALAELVGGSEDAFVARMNQEAARLGMSNTRFANATGLSSAQHYATAADLAKLASALIRDFPEYYPLYSQKEFRYNNITQANRNRLLWTDPHVDGVKTGHTEAAGWCLIASALRGERRLLSVVLGAASDASRAVESQKLLNYGFQAFDTVALYQSGKPVTTLPVWKGASPNVEAGFLADRHVTLARGQADKLALSLVAQERLIAPVRSGQKVGTVKVAFDGRPVAEFPLIALQDVPPASFVGRAWDTLRLWFTQ